MARVLEKHGVANARKIASAAPADSDTQSVIVTDGEGGEVRLSLGTTTFPAGLTPDQARMIAEQLNDAADRAEASGEQA